MPPAALPLAAPVRSASPAPAPSSATDTVPIRLLLIEPRPADAARLVELLGARPRPCFEVIAAARVAEGLGALGTQEFDAVLLALEPAEGDGFDALDQVAQLAPRTPVVVLTAEDDVDLSGRALEHGAQDHLWKGGLDAEQLARSLRYAIQRQRVKNELESVSAELRRANARLEKWALVDPLTDLLNRRGLEQVLSREIHWARRDGSDLMVFLLDLDDFKRINDGLGHAVGDAVLEGVGRALRTSLRATDHVARVGGDEFLVLLPRTRSAEALGVADKVRRAVAGSLVALGERNVGVTASVGVVEVHSATPTIDELLRACHLELRASKRAGKNRVSSAGADGDVEPAILGLCRRGEFRTVRQPIVRLATGDVVGFEFLGRTDSPGLELPADFFRESYEVRLLTDVDEACFRLALTRAVGLPGALQGHLNLFPSTLVERPVARLLEGLPQAFDAHRLCVEISEQHIVGEPSYLSAPVLELRRRGLRFAIDDVGFGRSSLESLMLLEPELIKIDRRRVHGLAGCRDLRRSLRRLLEVASSLGAGVVAEGIEEPADRDALVGLGVELGQGFLFGAPA